MGLFNGYLKEGPGIDKNAKKKKGFFLYIDILFRKFFNLIKANLLYVLFSIPFILIIFMFVAPNVMSWLGVTETLPEDARNAVYNSMNVHKGDFGKSQNTDGISALFGYSADNAEVGFYSVSGLYNKSEDKSGFVTVTVDVPADGEYTGYILCNSDKEERFEVMLDNKSIGNTAYSISDSVKYSSGDNAMYILSITMDGISSGRHAVKIQAPKGETAPDFSAFAVSLNGETENVNVYSVGEKSVDISTTAQNSANEGTKLVKDIESEILKYEALYFYILVTLFTILIFNFLGSGPISAAYAYASRCFTRGEHTWLFSDGKDQVKENIKNSMLMFILNMVVLLVTMIAYYFYGSTSFSGAMAYVAMFARPFMAVIIFLLIIINMFAYQVMVTYECKFKDLIKNSAILAIAKLPMCLLLTVISTVLIGVICLNIGDTLVSVIIYAVIGLMFTRYSIEFYAARVLEKNMRNLKKREKKNAAKITYLDKEE